MKLQVVFSVTGMLLGTVAGFSAVVVQTPSDLNRAFQQLYDDLERPTPYSYNTTSSTLRFSFVSPPTNQGTSTWRLQDDGIPDECTPNADPKKPLAVYLPGLDGYGISAATNQFDALSKKYELWRLVVSPKDRSSFVQVVAAVSDFIREISNEGDRPVTLIGESCGGLFATAVAHRFSKKQGTHRNPLGALVLVNPATSFDRSGWDLAAPLLTSLQYLAEPTSAGSQQITPYSVLGSLILATLIPDKDQQNRIFDTMQNLEGLKNGPVPSRIQSLLDGAREAFITTESRLPPELLDHRLKDWLLVGSSLMNNDRLRDIRTPTTVIVGEEDVFLPSKAEAERLNQTIDQCEIVNVAGRGHFVLDENVKLVEIINDSLANGQGPGKAKKRRDFVDDFQMPSTERIQEAIKETVEPFRVAHSPVFFTTDNNGKRWKGLVKFPKKEGPILIVANHQFGGLDLRLIVPELFEELGLLFRGLAHPIIFSSRENSRVNTAQGRNGMNFAADFEEFGAIPVTPKNYYKLMRSGGNGLLFPGGAKEALCGRDDYPLYWPEKTDFVRVAARFNATIVPLSCTGMVESTRVLLDSDSLLRLPGVEDRVKTFSSAMRGARYDAKDEDEVFLPPLSFPSAPSRNYFLFGRPISTTNLDPEDKESCQRVYEEAKSQVRKGIDDLLSASKEDPYANTVKRLAYERILGRQAPTFPIETLNYRR